MPTSTQPRPAPPPPAHEAPLPPARMSENGVRVLSGVPYAAMAGIRPLELDLYLPSSGPNQTPLVVFLHGGGWRLGSRRSAGPAYADVSPGPFEQIAASGIAVASLDYRLSGEAPWPTQLHDAKAAVRWLRGRADELNIDPDRVAGWGESAGGQLALLLGLSGPDFDGSVGVVGPASTVNAVVAWYAPSDLGALATDTGADPMAADSREAQLLGAPLPTVPDRVAEASPIRHVRGDAPPILLLHGQDDRLIPCVQSERLGAALAEGGAVVEVETYPGADHMWLGAPGAAEQALSRTVAFLHQTSTP